MTSQEGANFQIACQTIELAQATYDHIIELDLADSTNGSRDLKVDVLIGGDYYWKFIIGEIKRGPCGPIAVDTILGWVLSGPCDGANNSAAASVKGPSIKYVR